LGKLEFGEIIIWENFGTPVPWPWLAAPFFRIPRPGPAGWPLCTPCPCDSLFKYPCRAVAGGLVHSR